MLMILSLTVERLVCVRGERRLFRDVDFALKTGEALVVEGANGAGKTSLLRLLAGFLPAVDGSVLLATDEGTIRDGEERGHFVGWLGHQDAIKPQLSVHEQLRFFAQLYGARGALEPLLERTGLSRQKDLPCRYLSAGQKKRLGLARLMVCERPLWLLDEPFAALDHAGRTLAQLAMNEHCAIGGIVVAASHDHLGIDAQSLRLQGA
ncbi:MAG: heme ABC exporter ATP-binding protein CcmA [Rhizomicrobium sp.]